jgi:hypothetical protein
MDNVAEAMSVRTMVAQMMADPDLTVNLLLVALALVDVLHDDDTTGGTTGGTRRVKRTTWVQAVADRTGHAPRTVVHIIASDFPRYVPENTPAAGRPVTFDRPCPAPMVRRDTPCGRPGTHGSMDFDPATGRRWMIWVCNRHAATYLPQVEARRRAWQANGAPTPPHNAGGILRRYFGGNWDVIYAWAAPYEAARATPGEGKLPTPPRPQLRLIQGGAS